VSAEARPAIFRSVLRGLRLRCPRCGAGRLFGRGYRLRERCGACGLVYAPYAEDTWAMMYFSTAGLTGVVVIGLIVARPSNLMLGRATLAACALAVIVLSLPFRKGAAIAVNWLVATRSGGHSANVSSDGPDC
jgi:uncharacterized protein (DUF983 family)